MIEIQTKNLENITLVRLGGRLDSYRAPQLEETLAPIDFNILLDLTDLEFITSRGLWVILETYKRLKLRNYRLALAGLTGRVREIFSLTGVLDEISHYEDADEFLRNFEARGST